MSEDFERLPRTLQIRVDDAFDAALDSISSSSSPPPRKRRKLNTSTATQPEFAGGFLIESEDAPGGFILPNDDGDDDMTHPSEEDLIPFSRIPTALQILDLPPDDEEVLQVFHNAAGGWSNYAASDEALLTSDAERQGGSVTRKDWRAVCAVIVGDGSGEDETRDIAGGSVIDDGEGATTSGAENSIHPDEGEEEGEEEQDGDEDEDDAYQDPSLSSLSSEQGADSDSDEYLEEASGSRSKSKYNGRKSKRTAASISPGAPTPRQKQAALDAFALFFPSSFSLSDADLVTKRLMLKDIVRVAEMLKEKIKADEITEMLSLFSSAPDKSVSFDDFTRMMIMAKLA